MEYKALPIGIDNFEELIQKDYYYVDKTELIKQILDSKAKVTLFTRPRRFGKSLNLSMLQYYLEKASGEKAIILIDEYDVPLKNAHFRGFYQEMIDFIRGLLGVGLKTNNSLNFAVLTGCLRISKESIFTGLNNLYINSIQSTQYGEFFGFIQKDIDNILSYYGKDALGETVKDWYNGYIFGNVEVYNPWSIINYMFNAVFEKIEHPKPFWSNTSSNSIVHDLVERADMATRVELEELALGGTIEKPIREDITYDDIYKNSNNLWNFLYFTGYLRKVSERFEEPQTFVTLKLPNIEVAYIYVTTILEWTEKTIYKRDLSLFYKATVEGDAKNLQEELNKLLIKSISFFDGKESFYHGFISGLYQGFEDYLVESNREHGTGRSDLIVKFLTPVGKAFIFEFKVSPTFAKLENYVKEGLKQIEAKSYDKDLREYGYSDITHYAIAFFGKTCVVAKKDYK